MTFTSDNTNGYTDAELDTLNAEWDAIVEAEGLEEYTDEYNEREKQHSDAVSRRVSPTARTELQAALTDSLSPEAITAIAAYLQAAPHAVDDNDAGTSALQELHWFHEELIALIGVDEFNGKMNALGL